jgi:FkbM family methyltransferase
MELLRRIARSILGYDSVLYRAASATCNVAEIVRCEGPQMARALNRLARAARGPPEPLKFRNLLHPILVRPGTPDIATVINNIIREEYGQFRSKKQPHSMIDAGAYIGDTSAYFLSKYPSLKVVALEPDAENEKIARKNLAAYEGRVHLLNKALSSSSGIVHVAGTFDSALISNSGRVVESTTVTGLMTIMGWDNLDILKMDIEGAELDVLDQTADSWLPRVDLLILELHGSAIERQVKETLRRNKFRAKKYRSLWYCSSEQLDA